MDKNKKQLCYEELSLGMKLAVIGGWIALVEFGISFLYGAFT